MINRQTKAVIGSALFFLVLAAAVLFKPAPELVPSAALIAELAEADHQVARRKSGPASHAVDQVGTTLAAWSSEGAELTDVQRSDLSLLARDARILAAGMGGPEVEMTEATAQSWVHLRQRVDETFLGD